MSSPFSSPYKQPVIRPRQAQPNPHTPCSISAQQQTALSVMAAQLPPSFPATKRWNNVVNFHSFIADENLIKRRLPPLTETPPSSDFLRETYPLWVIGRWVGCNAVTLLRLEYNVGEEYLICSIVDFSRIAMSGCNSFLVECSNLHVSRMKKSGICSTHGYFAVKWS